MVAYKCTDIFNFMQRRQCLYPASLASGQLAMGSTSHRCAWLISCEKK